MAGSSWFATDAVRGRIALKSRADGRAGAMFSFTGSGTIYWSRERKTLRPNPADFQKRYLSLMVKATGNHTIRGHIFVKDKDGFWFQSRREFRFQPGKWQQFNIDITRYGAAWLPVGHRAAWDSSYAMRIQTAGISFYSSQRGKVELCCSKPQLTGKRPFPSLRVIDFHCPQRGKLYQRLSGTLHLSREELISKVFN